MALKTRDVTILVLGIGLALFGVGLTVATLNGGVTPAESVASAQNASTPSDAEPTVTPTTTPETARVGPLLTEASYSPADGGLITKMLTGRGDGWEVRVYRNGTHLTTLVPEPHELENGEMSPTTSKFNENASLPENKSFALVGSRIDAGGETASKSDDVYGITLVLPNVDANEHIRIEYVAATGKTTTLYDESGR